MSEIEIILAGGPLHGQTRKVPPETRAIGEMAGNWAQETLGPEVYIKSGITKYGRPVFRYLVKLLPPLKPKIKSRSAPS
jgi:hypothetical protein